MRAAATDSTRLLRFFQDKRVLPHFSYIIREASIWCLPEIWIPYGDTETLVTLGAENLGELIEPAQDSLAEEGIERLKGSLAEFSDLVICDRKPPTLEVVKRLLGEGPVGSKRIFAADPRRVEARLPELRGQVRGGGEKVSLPYERGIDLKVPAQREEDKSRLVLSTGGPDPLLGLLDSKVALPLAFVTNTRRLAYESRTSDDPTPFSETSSAEALKGVAERFRNSSFVTVIPRSSRPHRLLRDASFDEVKNSFPSLSAPRARAAIIGIGGEGYDDTFWDALRLVWSCIGCVKEEGEVLLVCECGEGLGADALEMLSTRRMTDQGPTKKKGVYVEGLEELQYLRKLKGSYRIILMSGLPDLYTRTKLGFATARGSAEAVGKLLGKLGRTAKVNVVTRACECSLSCE